MTYASRFMLTKDNLLCVFVSNKVFIVGRMFQLPIFLEWPYLLDITFMNINLSNKSYIQMMTLAAKLA